MKKINPTPRQLSYWRSMIGKHGNSYGKRWKIPDHNRNPNSYKNGFKKGNIVNLGRKMSSETKKKIGLANKGFKHSDETRKKMSLRMMGNKIHLLSYPNIIRKKISNSRKGKGRHPHKRTLLYGYVKKQKRGDSAYHHWRSLVYKRDNYKCIINDKKCKGKIEAHHILSWINHEELRYNINNGITLCQFHHPRKRSEERRLIPFFQSMVEVKEII